MGLICLGETISRHGAELRPRSEIGRGRVWILTSGADPGALLIGWISRTYPAMQSISRRLRETSMLRKETTDGVDKSAWRRFMNSAFPRSPSVEIISVVVLMNILAAKHVPLLPHAGRFVKCFLKKSFGWIPLATELA
jgi:hypothetical protein